MTARSHYRAALASLATDEWAGFLTEHSGLPGPRANLELAQAVADVADAPLLREYALGADEYRALCGAIGLGCLLADEASAPGADGDAGSSEARRLVAELRTLAADGRWRVREGVAMALQRVGDAAPERLWALADAWVVAAADELSGSDAAANALGSEAPGAEERSEAAGHTAERPPDRADNLLVLRAVAAGIAEPRLVKRAEDARQALRILDRITTALTCVPLGDRTSDEARVLRQALGYCWSVALVGAPAEGFDALDRWAATRDPDALWIIRSNLTKARLRKADPVRAESLEHTLA